MKKEDVSRYTKQQIINSKKFSGYSRDVLIAILQNDCSYSIQEAEKLLNEFLEREVK